MLPGLVAMHMFEKMKQGYIVRLRLGLATKCETVSKNNKQINKNKDNESTTKKTK